jgi:hypothetical protein
MGDIDLNPKDQDEPVMEPLGKEQGEGHVP